MTQASAVFLPGSSVKLLQEAFLHSPILARPEILETLEQQRMLVTKWEQPYVSKNSGGRSIQEENLGKVWVRALSKAGVPYRRMYDIRHTFASWALAAGESPEWVARTMSLVDTTMVYRTYWRYISSLTRQDGSAFEERYAAFAKK
jgi:integrase